ncbi:MAG: peptidoglycan DD-metalloendopeptidase family protein [Rothia sp. (in: high G+C Gram-positive bacteria)]|nr:peptidoglycan DD-metalloendopeptidase family protein [Rothia sp. (in: high G+C Gram-positive bacteria)]
MHSTPNSGHRYCRWLALVRGLLVLVLLCGFSLDSGFADGAEPGSQELARPSWRAPVNGKVQLLADFKKPAQNWLAGHRGVDLALSDGKILSPAAGKVVFSGRVVDRTVLTIEHDNGLRSSFEPVKDALPLGSQVRAGDLLAQLDQAGPWHCPGPCLHWGVRQKIGDKQDYINPLVLLGLDQPSILLPLTDDFAA